MPNVQVDWKKGNWGLGGPLLEIILMNLPVYPMRLIFTIFLQAHNS